MAGLCKVVALLKNGSCHFKSCLRFELKFHTSSQSNENAYSKITDLLNNYPIKAADVQFSPFRLRSFILGRNFTSANIDTVQFIVDKTSKEIREPESISHSEVILRNVYTPSADFQTLFHKGFETVIKFTTESLSRKKSDDDLKKDYALMPLLYFVKNLEKEQVSLRAALKTTQADKVTVVLANHLLSRLSSSRNYYVTDNGKMKYETCPCNAHCNDEIQYGRTGLGSEKLWYGFPDIILQPIPLFKEEINCPVVFPSYTDMDIDFSEADDNENQIFEVEQEENILRRHTQQCVAQTIMFSLYKDSVRSKVRDTSFSDVTLVPTIAITPEAFDVYLYDSKYDILLRNNGRPIPLWEQLPQGLDDKQLKLSSILQLWMLLHHSTFGPVFLEKDISEIINSCQFQSQIGYERFKEMKQSVDMKKTFQRVSLDEIDLPKINFMSNEKAAAAF